MRRDFSVFCLGKVNEKVDLFILSRRGLSELKNMTYFVIGVSGVTCGGKTTLTKLLQRSFPWARVIHQDKYFYPEDYPGHLRVPEMNEHINFDRWSALDMEQMEKDVHKILHTPPTINGLRTKNEEIPPNFAEGLELLRNLKDIDFDTSKYSHIPIIIIEGFIMFESEDLYEKCDMRLFLTLDEETCRHRRSLRVFDPPDGEGYFEHCIWPEYQRHFKHHIKHRPAVQVLSGKTHIGNLWKDAVSLITNKMEEKFHYKINKAEGHF